MMVSRLGKVQGDLRLPCLYFIFIKDYVYVGETQKIPIIRWGQHISKRGTFYSRLKSKDEELCEQLNSMSFLAYSSKELINDVRDFEVRSVLKYIEHKVHEVFICHSVLGPKYELISDTSRTAPSHCAYDWAEALAQEIVTSCYIDWKSFRHEN